MNPPKSKKDQTRESVRDHRFKRRIDEFLNIIQEESGPQVNDRHGYDYDDKMNVSSSFSQSSDLAVNDQMTIQGTTSSISFSSDGCPVASGSSSDGDTNQCVDYENDDEVIDDFILTFDFERSSKPFPSSPLSIRDACLVIMRLCRRLNLDKSGIKLLLDGIRDLCPIDAQLPRTVKGLLKIIGEFSLILLMMQIIVPPS